MDEADRLFRGACPKCLVLFEETGIDMLEVRMQTHTCKDSDLVEDAEEARLREHHQK